MDTQPSQPRVVEQPTDDELVARANAGDAAAFEALYLRYRDWVTYLAARFTRGDAALALDVMQDVFLQFLRRFPDFELRSQLKTYLYPVVRHTALAMMRKQRHRDSLDSDISTPVQSQAVAAGDELAALQSAIDRLESGHREALLLRYVDDLSLQEIAEAMQLPLGTVKSRLHNAVAILRQDSRLRDFFEPP